MRIIRNAKALSHVIGVVFALALLPHLAQAGAGPDIDRADDTSDFAIGAGFSVGMMSLRDVDVIWSADTAWPTDGQDMPIKALGMMSLGESGLTLAPVGSSGDVRWGLFNRGAWEASDAAAEIPEPAPLAILGIAILALGFYRRYRRT